MESPKSKAEKISQLYLAIIMRYKDLIEEKERLSVAELPTLVTPKDSRVIMAVEQIKGQFSNYTYEENFIEAAKKSFDFVKNSIEDITLPVQFWLTPADTLNFGIGDFIDKNILLCSMLIQLGNPSSKVLVTIDSSMQAFVYFEYNKQFYLLDQKDGIREFGSKDLLYNSVLVDKDSTAYEFNNQTYSDIR
ncbi:MAG: hypothetical protein ACP5RM_01460 [Candidatus Micrarchaeia archaeon]